MTESDYIEPIWIQKKIEEDELRLINLKAGHYYISRDAKIYSLNLSFPRELKPIPKLNGELVIVLYTPVITAYDVPDLMLSTFSPSSSSETLYPCFYDADPSNCHLTNLYWGDLEESKRWRQISMSRTAAKRSELVASGNVKNEEIGVAIEPVPSMVRKTPVLSSLINMIIDTTQRMMSNNVYDDDTQFVLRMVILRFKHVRSQDYLPLENLRSAFEVRVDDPRIMVMLKRFHERFERVGTTTG
jgi:hypothetical protein